jgi:hypothetical protein
MKNILIAAVVVSIFPLAAYAKEQKLPDNVTVRPYDKRNSYIDIVDYSFEATSPVPFSKIKLCVAENVSNNAVSLTDSAGAFVASGNYYSTPKSQTVQGGGIFKFVDDTQFVLIAMGTLDGGSTALGLTRNIVKFDLKAGSNEKQVTLKFSNITRAQQNTGNLANDGFQPLGTWKGSGYLKILTALDGLANKVRSCVSGT